MATRIAVLRVLKIWGIDCASLAAFDADTEAPWSMGHAYRTATFFKHIVACVLDTSS